MESFETVTVNTAAFFEMALVLPLKATVFLFLFLLTFGAIGKWVIGADNAFVSANIPYAFFLLFKVLIYGFLFLLVFFYDFSTEVWIWALPERMPLSSAFVGVLAAYEAVSCLISAAQAFVGNNK